MSRKRVKMCQIESVRLRVNEQLTSVGEQILEHILCVLEKQSGDYNVVRVFVLERLTAAAERICSLFQREMEELHNTHLDKLHTADDVPLLSVCKEQVSPDHQERSPSPLVQEDQQDGRYQDFHYLCEELSAEQQERSPSLVLEEPESPQIKEEQVELLLRPEEAFGSALTSPTVKSEDDENKEEDPPAGTSAEHMKTQAYIKYWGASQPTGDDDDDDDSDDGWDETREAQSVSQDLEAPKQTPPKTHSGEKPFSCEICGKGCNYRCELKKHMSTHTGEKPFNCTICGKGCNYMCDLKKHMRTHTGEKAFICTVCGKGCSYMCDLKNHMRTHTGEKPFSCTVCGNSFSVKTNLSQHMRIHTGEKTFSCSICSKVFVQMSNLKRHMRTHTGEKPFSCADPLVYSLWQQL